MKNQYVGDVGDYGKYGLLRFFAIHGVTVGVNWYLTEDDGTNDGKHTSYLDKPEEQLYDPVVYGALKSLADRAGKTVRMVEDAGIIPGALYYSAILNTTDFPWKERKAIRNKWHMKALETLKGVQLVFADPDNGTIGKKSPAGKSAEKFTLPEELADYYRRGQNVVYYCQKARRTEEQWEEKKREMHRFLPDAKLCAVTFRRGTQRSYIFAVHPSEDLLYRNLLKEFLATAWGTAGKKQPFVYEPIV